MTRGNRRVAWGVFLLALAARAAYAWRQGAPFVIVGDALEYHDYAMHLVETGRYAGPAGEVATRMPGYPVFLAVLRVLCGDSTAVVLAAQCFLGALTCVLLYRLAARFLPDSWAAACGLIGAVYFDMIEPSANLLSECLYSFFLVASAYALFKKEWPAARRAVVFGALSGCLYLVRPEPLPYILATGALLPYLLSGFGRRHALAALAATALVAGLWVGRNFAVFHRFVPASSVGKHVAYLSLLLPAEQLGLAPEGRYSAPEGLGELEQEADYARAHRELARRLTWTQIVRAHAYNLMAILYPFLPAYDWSYVALIPFWLLGYAKALRRRELWPIAGAVLCSISVFIFFGGPASRYREGVSPFLVLLATVGLRAAVEAWGLARARAWALGWIGFNFVVWLFQAQSRGLALWVKGMITR